MADEWERACCVRGYHIYRNVWQAVVGEVLDCVREPQNSSDRYAIAVKKDQTTIGHLPRKLSRLCSLFMRRGGTIQCRVTGHKRYSADLVQGGLEIPCSLTFKSTTEELKKLKKLWKL